MQAKEVGFGRRLTWIRSSRGASSRASGHFGQRQSESSRREKSSKEVVEGGEGKEQEDPGQPTSSARQPAMDALKPVEHRRPELKIRGRRSLAFSTTPVLLRVGGPVLS